MSTELRSQQQAASSPSVTPSTSGGPPSSAFALPAIVSSQKPPTVLTVSTSNTPINTPVKPEITPHPPTPSATDPKKPSPPVSSRPQTSENLPSEPEFVTIPSYSKWFSWNNAHECEVRLMPEFFDGKSPSKNPNLYKYYRNSIIKKFRCNPSKKITFTEVRRTIIGDVGTIRKVFDFLETWGLINYSPSNKQVARWEDKDNKSSSGGSQAGNVGSGSYLSIESSRKVCSGCKTPCNIACFVSEKHDLVLCARCYVRSNYRVGIVSSDFRRVEISETKTDWTERETLLLLEATMYYGDDWTRVAEYVGGRTEKECVARFIKLPFGEQFVEPVDQSEDDKMLGQMSGRSNADPDKKSSAKRMRLSPLADASNPIMAQAAFLSALAGEEVAEAAAQAAVKSLCDMSNRPVAGSVQTLSVANGEQGEAVPSTELLLKEEEGDLEKAVRSIGEVQMKDIQAKIAKYEEAEEQLEREWQEVGQMKHQLFLDQLAILFHKASRQRAGEKAVSGTLRTE